MTKLSAELSPSPKARIAGLFYLLVFITGGVAAVSGRLVALGDATGTATNILAHEPSFLLGFAAYLMVIACYIVVTALFYDLFKPVNGRLSLLAAFFSLVGCATQASACAFYLAPLVVLRGEQSLSAFRVEELQTISLMFLKIYSQAYNIGLVFFGFYCLLIGYLILRSIFLPRILGAFMACAGLAWLSFLSPPLASYLSPYNRAVGALAELTLTLWLLVVGVNVERWREQADAAGELR